MDQEGLDLGTHPRLEVAGPQARDPLDPAAIAARDREGAATRQQVESSLRDQAELLDLAHDAIMLLEMDGTIVSWNNGAVETYGFSRADALGHVAHDLLKTVFPQPLEEIRRIAEGQGRWEGELVHTCRDGRSIVVASRWAVQAATAERPARVMEINRDITQRKEIESALHAMEAELQLVTGTTPVTLVRCGRNLRYRFVNRAAAELFGKSPQELVGQSLPEVMGAEAFERIRPYVERVLDGEVVEYEAQIPYPNTGLRWVRAHYMPDLNAEGIVCGWIASIMDITERKQVEDKLRESERTERLLAEIGALAAKISVADSVQLGDAVQAICEHVAAEVGASRCGFGRVDQDAGVATIETEALGALPSLKGRYPLSEYARHLAADGLLGRFTSIDDLATDPRTADRYERLYEPIGIRSSVNVPLHRDGQWVAHFWVSSEHARHWTESEIELVRRTAERIWLVIEQGRVAADLRASEARLARELAAMRRLQQVSIQLIQDEDLFVLLRKILVASTAILGTDMGNIQLLDAETRRLRIVVHQGLGRRLLDHFADHGWELGCDAAMKRKQRVIVEDIEQEASAQGTLGLEVLIGNGIRAIQSTPIVGREGRLLGMLSNHFRVAHRPSESDQRYLDLLARMAADLIERKQTEEALRNADRRKDEFLATLAHELRNPLAPIRNAAQLLQLQNGHDPSTRAAHEIIDRQLKHMVRLVDDLLEVSRITTGRIELKKQRVDLGTIVAQAVETVRNLIDGHRHRLTVLLPPDPIPLDADPVRLTQVIANLLNNACKYTSDGGSIRVGARRDEDHVIVTVRDSGAGIPPPMLDEVFGLFTQIDRSLERSTGGLGIGLHLVKRLVEMHGGTVSANSEGEHQGSEFEVRLPAPSAARNPAHEAADARNARPMAAQRRILLVDDNHDSVESLAMLLGYLGHETEIAHDGRQAVEKTESWKPDVILLDIGLPIMNGYDACRAIRRLPFARDIRIIALSGWGQEQDRSMAKEAGFDDHLVKPVSLPALTRILDETEPAEA